MCFNFGNLSLKSEPRSDKKSNQTEAELDESFHSATDDEEDFKNEPKLMKKSPTINDAVIEASYWRYQIKLKQIQLILIDKIDDLNVLKKFVTDEFKSSIAERCYILSPLDLFFNIHQCVYTDDVNLPAWKLSGNLPRIEFDLTETKLEQSIGLVMSLPFPQNAADKSANKSLNDTFYDEFEEENTNESNESEKLINTLDVLNSDSVDSSSKPMPVSPSMSQKLDNCQAINLEFSFEINEIIFKLKEDKSANFDFIEFKISSFGTIAQFKTYDNHIDVYLKQISLQYGLFNDVNGDKLYLLRSVNEKSSSKSSGDLINIRIINTSVDSPTLNSLHANTLTKVDVDLCMIDFVVNLIAIKNMLKLADNLERYLKQTSTESTSVDLASKLMKPKAKSSANQVLLSDFKIMSLLNSKGENKNSKKPKFLVDENLIEFKLNARLDGIRARICTSKKNYFQVEVKKFESVVTGKLAEMDVDLSLNSITVLDLDSSLFYSKMLSLKEDSQNLINLQVRLVNPPRTSLNSLSDIAKQYQKEKFYFKNYLNEEHFDIIVKANISKLQVVFLFKQLNTFMVSL